MRGRGLHTRPQTFAVAEDGDDQLLDGEPA